MVGDKSQRYDSDKVFFTKIYIWVYESEAKLELCPTAYLNLGTCDMIAVPLIGSISDPSSAPWHMAHAVLPGIQAHRNGHGYCTTRSESSPPKNHLV